MTMTDETTSTSATRVEMELPWQTLSDLASVSATCLTDVAARPILTAIHLVSDGTTITATATDSYALAIVTTTPEDAPPVFDVLIPATWLNAALKATKPGRLPRLAVRLTLAPDERGGTVTLSTLAGDVSTSGVLTPGAYPHVAHLVPAASQYGHERAAFNAQFLARMSKILPPETGKRAPMPRPWVCEMTSATRPSVWTTKVRDCEGLFLLMPVRQ